MPSSNGSDVAPLVYTCHETTAPWHPTSEWSVNGQLGGNGTVGTISGSGLVATYTAPAKAPNPPKVRVSVRTSTMGQAGKALLFAYLSVGQPAPYKGTFTVNSPDAMFPFYAKGTATITPRKLDDGSYDDDVDRTLFDVTGSMTLDPSAFSQNDMDCTAVEATQQLTNDILVVRKDPLGMLWNLNATWTLNCTSNQQSFQWPIELQWLTGCDPETLVPDYVPLTDPNRLNGSYTRGPGNCSMAAETDTVTWDFSQ
jgi:hypothetical protein